MCGYGSCSLDESEGYVKNNAGFDSHRRFVPRCGNCASSHVVRPRKNKIRVAFQGAQDGVQPCSVRSARPVSRSHVLTVPSPEAEIARCPSVVTVTPIYPLE